MTRRLLTLAEAAVYVGVKDTETVRRLTRVPASQGGLPFVCLGSRNIRIDSHDLERWIQLRKRRAPETRRTSSSSSVTCGPPSRSTADRDGGAALSRGRT